MNIDDTPKEMAVGAMAINPNSTDRIAKVLDEVIESADMINKFSVKIKSQKFSMKTLSSENLWS